MVQSDPARSTTRAARRKLAVVVAGVLALGLLAVVVARDRVEDPEPAVAASGIVPATLTKQVDVVDLRTPEQAAIAVSHRLFARADLVVLTDTESADAAIDAATTLGVPVLLDDPATAAELTRLRARQVLTFGTVDAVIGAIAAQTDPDALASQLEQLQAGRDPVAEPPADAPVVLMKSATIFAAAATSAEVAGATVVQTVQGDLRKDAPTAALLADRPESPVIALGAPFTSGFAYSLAAVQQEATQIGGGYFALPDRRFVGLHGALGDPSSGMLGQQDTAASIKIITSAAAKFEANDQVPVVPMLQVVASFSDETPLAELESVVDAAEEAGVYVLIDLQPGSSTFVDQAKTYEPLLARQNVGLTLEPAQRDGGVVSAAEINQVSTWLADLTLARALPQKLLVIREPATVSAVEDRADIDTSRPELAVVLDVDVAGTPAEKLAAWRAARTGAPKGAAFGWMQYKTQDQPMFTVNQTYKLITPYPSVVTYQ